MKENGYEILSCVSSAQINTVEKFVPGQFSYRELQSRFDFSSNVSLLFRVPFQGRFYEQMDNICHWIESNQDFRREMLQWDEDLADTQQ